MNRLNEKGDSYDPISLSDLEFDDEWITEQEYPCLMEGGALILMKGLLVKREREGLKCPTERAQTGAAVTLARTLPGHLLQESPLAGLDIWGLLHPLNLLHL
ncbi:Myosin-3 like [Senna tora]|uniref:Myosin-3 like n=1 Tax=Senna tora TaxID=362788 RepID=A0A834TFN7_9FABA|nr:Myosin-3 like [Senna tora]